MEHEHLDPEVVDMAELELGGMTMLNHVLYHAEIEQQRRGTHAINFDGGQIAATVAFEYDLTYYGGDYSYDRDTVHVPVSRIEQVGEEGAFEQVTGFDRCHIVSIRSEGSAASGDEKTQKDLDEQQVQLKLFAEKHYATCSECRQAAKRREGAQS